MRAPVLLGFVALGLAGCAERPPPPRYIGGHVVKHFVVVIREPDPLAPEDTRAASLLTRSVAAGPLAIADEDHTAFRTDDPRYSVLVGWRQSAECLDVTVARRGLAPFDDFAAHGCVKPDEPTKTVATVTGANGAPIEVQVWILET